MTTSSSQASVTQRLLENRLFAKLEKCEFHAQSVPFLGFILSPEGIRMDPAKVEAVANWPTPDSRKAVSTISGVCQFLQAVSFEVLARSPCL